MKYRLDKKYKYAGMTALMVIVLSILFYYFLFHNSNFVGFVNQILNICRPILYGLLFSYLLTPVINFQENVLYLPLLKKAGIDTGVKGKKRLRTVTILITFILVISLVYGFLKLVIPQINNNIQNIINQFPTYIDNLMKWIQNILKNNPSFEATVTKYLNDYSVEINNWLKNDLMPNINNIMKSFTSNVLGIISGVFGIIAGLFNLIIGAIISIYVLASKEKFSGQSKKIIYSIFKTERANSIVKNFRFVNKTFNSYLSGAIADAFIVGIITFIALSIMKNPYPVLIAVIVGVTNIIPFFGPYLGGIPSAILILMVNPLQALYFIIFIIVLQQIDGNIINPRIVGSSTGLPGFWVICSITVFGGLFGVFGMFIAVPSVAVIFAGISFLVDKSLERKGILADTEQYINVQEIKDTEFINNQPKSYKHIKTKNPEDDIENSEDIAEQSKNNKIKNVDEIKTEVTKDKEEDIEDTEDKK